MRWVDRGPEPDRVAQYARQYTQGWINYYQNRVDGLPVNEAPRDSYWQEFRPPLARRTNNNCWYCERQCRATGGWAPSVDHFRPRSRFPELTYEWPNWIFSCRRCNEIKNNNWPESGYVDPCAADVMERPEQYLDYEPDTGKIVARKGLSDTARKRAWDTIDDLELSGRDLVNPRFTSVRQFIQEFTERLLELSATDRDAFIPNFLALPPAGRVAYLTFIASSNGETMEYTGVKAIVAEKLLREVSI